MLRVDSVLVEQEQTRVVALVRDMMECMVEDQYGVHSVVHLWCVSSPAWARMDGQLWVWPSPEDSAMLVALEDVSICLKTRNLHVNHDTYT